MSATQKQVLISGEIQLTIGVFCFIFGVIERATISREYYGSITSIPCLGIWMGLWVSMKCLKFKLFLLHSKRNNATKGCTLPRILARRKAWYDSVLTN
jgi:hypothetical protein